MSEYNIVGVIPARYNSTRLPGKPLADICGKPMVWWAYKNVSGINGLDKIFVATDDERIKTVCNEFCIPVLMTSPDHRTAANRLYEVSQSIDAEYFIQLNGDEPLLDERIVRAAIPSSFPMDVEFGSNVITKIDTEEHLKDPSNIKVVFDSEMNALYMSRNIIPMNFKTYTIEYYKHIGVIGYNRKMLEFYNNSSPGRLELAEGIDTLRFIDYGKQLKLQIVPECRCLSVDTSKDLDEVRGIIGEKYSEKRELMPT